MPFEPLDFRLSECNGSASGTPEFNAAGVLQDDQGLRNLQPRIFLYNTPDAVLAINGDADYFSPAANLLGIDFNVGDIIMAHADTDGTDLIHIWAIDGVSGRRPNIVLSHSAGGAVA